MKGRTATMRRRVTRKRSTKRLKDTENLFRKNQQLKMSVNSSVKVAKIIGPRKAFYRQRIPESSYARNETVDIDILVTSIRIMSRPPSRKMKWKMPIEKT